MKNRKQFILSIFAMTMILFLTGNSIITGGEHTKSFIVQKNGNLKVNVNPGEVKISAWDKMEVLIKLKGVDEDEIKNDIRLEQEGNTIFLESRSSWGWMGDAEYIISVPFEFNLDIKTSSGDVSLDGNLIGNFLVSSAGGDIDFKDVNGEVKVYTSGGDIKSGDIKGNLKLNTQGGDIILGNLNGKEVSVGTMGGDVKIKNVGSDIEVKTYGGDIIIGDIGGNANIVTYGGNIKLSKVQGSALCETYGGNISLDGANGEVEVNTYGGNINMKSVKGTVNANTHAGNITLELTPSGSGKTQLSSSSGNITLSLPSTAKATIRAEISLHGWWKKETDKIRIHSDFESKSYTTSEDSDEITAVYELNGGGSVITIKTVNSEINIKKLK